jgi:ferredoxin
VDRKDFLTSAFKMLVAKSFDLIVENPLVNALEKLGEEKDPACLRKERPPGALPEREFLKKCTGCDACMIACPVNVVMIEDLEKRYPVIYPDKDPCIHCQGYPCIQICPTGALLLQWSQESGAFGFLMQ